jgi:hypothetical protein
MAYPVGRMAVLALMGFGLPLAAQDQAQATASAALFARPDPFATPAKPEGRTFYRWSVAALAAGNAADTFSSWKQPESNPVLGGTFDGRSMAIKAGLIGTTLALEKLALRHNPGLYKRVAWFNMAIGGGFGAIAARNFSVR